MQKHLRCEAVDKYGHRCSKKVGHDKLTKRKRSDVEDPTVKLHTSFGRSW